MYSAEFVDLEDDKDKEPSKVDKFLDRILGDKLQDVLIYISVIFSIIFSVFLFMVLPNLVASILPVDKSMCGYSQLSCGGNRKQGEEIVRCSIPSGSGSYSQGKRYTKQLPLQNLRMFRRLEDGFLYRAFHKQYQGKSRR